MTKHDNRLQPEAPPAPERTERQPKQSGGVGSGEGQGEYGGEGYSAQGDFSGAGSADPNADLNEGQRRAVEQARQANPELGFQNREEAPVIRRDQ